MLRTLIDLTIIIEGRELNVEPSSLRLYNGNKSYFIDIVQLNHEQFHDVSIITCELEIDEFSNVEIFGGDSAFDLTDDDLFKNDTYATVLLENEKENIEIISMELSLLKGCNRKIIQCKKA